jgi:rubrerythrin
MKQFSVTEILKYAVQIEEESQRFYTEAGTRLRVEELRRLAAELAEAEVDHADRLRRLLAKRAPESGGREERVALEPRSLERIVSGAEIAPDAGARDILNTALERERNTESVYRMMQAATNLTADITEIFTYLAAQEAGHVKTIANKLKAL